MIEVAFRVTFWSPRHTDLAVPPKFQAVDAAIRAEVLRILDETPGAPTLRLDRPQGQHDVITLASPIDLAAGTHIIVTEYGPDGVAVRIVPEEEWRKEAP